MPLIVLIFITLGLSLISSNFYHQIIHWLQVLIPECGVVVEGRFGHSATAVQLNPSLIEITIFGGCLDLDFVGNEAVQLLLEGTIVLKFGMLYNDYNL